MVQYLQLKKMHKVDIILLNEQVEVIFCSILKSWEICYQTGDLFFDAVYLNPLASYKQWYTHYEN